MDSPDTEQIDLSRWTEMNFDVLSIFCRLTPYTSLTAHKDLDLCPALQSLSLYSLHLDVSVLEALCHAALEKKFPKLKQLRIGRCTGLAGKFSTLFWSKWPGLAHVSITDCQMEENDWAVLASFSKELQSLIILPEFHAEMFGSQKTCLNATPVIDSLCTCDQVQRLWLQIRNGDTETFRQLILNLNQGTCPKLEDLVIFMLRPSQQEQITRTPRIVFTQDQSCFENCWDYRNDWFVPISVPSLRYLTLRGVIQSMQNLFRLSQSPVLPNLEKLDLMDSSGISGGLSMLFRRQLASLRSLVLFHGLSSDHEDHIVQAACQGRLPRLKKVYLCNCRNEMKVGLNAASFELSFLFGRDCGVSDNGFQNMVQDCRVSCLSSLSVSDESLRPPNTVLKISRTLESASHLA